MKLMVLWTETYSRESVVEIEGDQYTGTDAQHEAIMKALPRASNDVHDRTIGEVETLRPGSTAEVDGPVPLDPSRFDIAYKAKMVAAYPVIADMTPEQMWFAGPDEREAAFVRVLNAKNLRETHIQYLDSRKPIIPAGSAWKYAGHQYDGGDDHAEDIAFEKSHGWDGPEREGPI